MGAAFVPELNLMARLFATTCARILPVHAVATGSLQSVPVKTGTGPPETPEAAQLAAFEPVVLHEKVPDSSTNLAGASHESAATSSTHHSALGLVTKVIKSTFLASKLPIHLLVA